MRGASAAPGRAEPGLSSPSPAPRPAWSGRLRPPVALLPRPPPAAQTGCAGRRHRLPRLPQGRRAAEPAAQRSPGAPDAAWPSPPCARDGGRRCPTWHSGSCSPCRRDPTPTPPPFSPPGSVRNRRTLSRFGTPKPRADGRGEEHPSPLRCRSLRLDPRRVRRRPSATPTRELKGWFRTQSLARINSSHRLCRPMASAQDLYWNWQWSFKGCECEFHQSPAPPSIPFRCFITTVPVEESEELQPRALLTSASGATTNLCLED